MLPDDPVSDWLEKQHRQRPDAVAWTFPDGNALTWQALAERVDALARRLATNARSDTPIALIMADRGALAFHVLATLRAGLTALPLHPLPASRLAQLLAGSGCIQAIADPDVTLPPGIARIPLTTGVPARRTETVHPTLLLATSGSSGKPHFARHGPRTLAASARATAAALELQTSDRWLACLPMDHAGGLMIPVRVLATGARVHFLNRFDPCRALDLVRQEGITHVSLVPAMLHALLAADDGPAPASLQAVLIGGGPLSKSLADAAQARGWPLHVTWGMTETASHVTLAKVDGNWQPGCVGRPLPGVHLDIEPAGADDVVGRVKVTGPMVMHGYLGEQELATDAINRTLITSDLGRLDEAGRLMLHGRADTVLNTGGHLVDPERLEAELLACPGIVAAGVTAVEDPVWGERLVLFHEGDIGAGVIEDWCRAHLPSWERPRSIRRIAALPRTRTGKLDRARLRELAAGIHDAWL